MSLINISNLTFGYDGSADNVFENVSFHIDTDWKLGFTGRNGRGKTTFLNLLLGKYEYSGSITSSVSFEYFPCCVADASIDTIKIIRGICPGFIEWELMRELSLLGVREEALYRPFETLSAGERTKALLAALFLRENSFLLIDEPTNHLDMAARELVGDYLNSKKGFILVSHDRVFLDGCIDHILAINKANIEVQRGNFSTWLVNKERQDGFELAENERLKKDVKRLAAASRRTSDWSGKVEKTKFGHRDSGVKPDKGYIGHKSAKMMKRSKSIEARRQAALDEKSTLLKNTESTESLKITPLKYHKETLVALSNISVYYEGRAACEKISFSIMQGERVALRGRNGSGKSSILKLICREDLTFAGEFHKGSGIVISYVPQDASGLCGSLSGFAEGRRIDETLFRAILRKLDFSREQFEKDMGDYSGGQKKKVLLAGSLCEKAHLYVWDEPLNYVDVISRMQIESLLLAYKPTLLFVEHDSAFCGLATKTIQLG